MTVQLMAGLYRAGRRGSTKLLIGKVTQPPEKMPRLHERTIQMDLDEVTEDQIVNQVMLILSDEYLVGGCQGWRKIHDHGGLIIFDFDYDEAL
jgi:hypothetical protein